MDELILRAERLKKEGVISIDAFLDYMADMVRYLNSIVYDNRLWHEHLQWSYVMEDELLTLVQCESWKKKRQYILEGIVWRLKKTK